jgi:hypothetical protein
VVIEKEEISLKNWGSQVLTKGSFIVESANKLVVEARLKGTGMAWSVEQVDPMLGLRNVCCNSRWEEGWLEWREEQKAEEWTERLRRAKQKVEASNTKESASEAKSELEPALILAGVTKVTTATATEFSPNVEAVVVRNEAQEVEKEGLVMERVVIEQVIMKDELSHEKVEKPKATNHPAADHPWRKMFVGKGRYQPSDFAKN